MFSNAPISFIYRFCVYASHSITEKNLVPGLKLAPKENYFNVFFPRWKQITNNGICSPNHASSNSWFKTIIFPVCSRTHSHGTELKNLIKLKFPGDDEFPVPLGHFKQRPLVRHVEENSGLGVVEVMATEFPSKTEILWLYFWVSSERQLHCSLKDSLNQINEA